MRRAILLALALCLAGCSAGTATEPAAPQPATPQPAPAGPSNAVEQLTDRLVVALAADPPGWPSRSDYELVVLPFYDDRPDFMDDALADFEHFAAVYLAAECVAGRETTPAGFREMVGRTFTPGSDRIPRIAAEAQSLITDILAQDPQEAPPPCLRPYVIPDSAVEAISALRLARPILAANRPGLLPWQVDAQVREIALSWFGRPESLYAWACSHPNLCNLLSSP